MTKTKVLLAFGSHRGTYDTFPVRGNRRFFRQAVVPFIEENVEKEGARAAIIHDCVCHNWLRPPLDDIKVEIIKKNLKHEEIDSARIEGVIKEYERQIPILEEQSRKLLGLMNEETRGMTAWGFETAVRRINRRNPNQIIHFIEPQEIASVSLDLEEDVQRTISMLTDDYETAIDCIVKFIKALAMETIYRDKGVVALADKLMTEDPEMVIIIPRGWAHKGMATLFDRKKYDITIAEEQNKNVPFAIEAALRYYNLDFDERNLRRYAILEHDANEFLEKKGLWFFLTHASVLVSRRLFRYTIDGFIKKARKYAISKNPEVAEELGLSE